MYSQQSAVYASSELSYWEKSLTHNSASSVKCYQIFKAEQIVFKSAIFLTSVFCYSIQFIGRLFESNYVLQSYEFVANAIKLNKSHNFKDNGNFTRFFLSGFEMSMRWTSIVYYFFTIFGQWLHSVSFDNFCPVL